MSAPPPIPALPELLDGYRNTALIAMGNHQGWFRNGVPKAEMVRRLAERLPERARVRTAAAALDPAARAALAFVQRQGGVTEADTLEELLQLDGVVASRGVRSRYGVEYATGDPTAMGNAFQDVLARLEVAGLVLGFTPLNAYATVTDLGVSATYCIPESLARHLPPPPPQAESPLPALAREVPGDPEAFGRRQYLVWSYLWRHRPRLLKTGLLSKKDLVALSAQLDPRPDAPAPRDETERPELHFHRRLLESLYLVNWLVDACEVDEEGARTYWSVPAAERAWYAFASWAAMRGWNELDHLPNVRWTADDPTDRWFTPEAVRDARAVVAARMAELGRDGAWVGVRRLVHELRRTARDFLIRPLASGPSATRDYRYGRAARHRYGRWGNAVGWVFEPVADDRQGWERVESAFVRQVVEALHRMGLCDAGLDDAGEMVAFRLGALGRWLLATPPGSWPAEPPPDPPVAPEGARVVVQPNLRILTLGPVPVANLIQLEAFADRVSTDRALELELSRASVYRGQLAGLDDVAIVRALERLSGQPLAQNVVRTIQDWQRLHEQITVHRRTTLLQAADAALLARIAAAAEAAGADAPVPRVEAAAAADAPEDDAARAGRAGPATDDADGAGRDAPRAALAGVPGSAVLARVLDPGRAAKALAELGLVAATPRDPTAAGTVVWDADDGIRFRHNAPSLYLLGALQRLAEHDPATGRWRAGAAAALRARTEHGLDAPAQVAAWTTLTAGALPDGLEARIKAWCGHYPPATLHHLVLVELPSAEALADVRAAARAEARARAFQPKGPLLMVDEAHLEALRAVLAAYGIALKKG